MAALQNSELLAKNQVLQNYAATVTEQTDERSEPERKQAKHGLSYNKTLAAEESLCY
jgi:hypothetical protein